MGVTDIKISVITVVYNCVNTIEQTILSVIRQTSRLHIEYIIIDGNSSDGTQAIIEKYRSELVHYSSEQDRGLYDAMNKGMEVASGDFCLFLNSGDVFYRPDVMEKFIHHIDEMNMIYFATAVMTDRRTMYRLVPNEHIDPYTWVKRGGLPNHQTMLFPKIFYKQEQYDLQLRIAADDDYKIRALGQYPSCYVSMWVVLFELGGLSRSFSSWNHVKRRINEVIKIHKKHPKAPSTDLIGRYKYTLKLIGIYLLTRITGFRDEFEKIFNKFNPIAPSEIGRFNVKY